MRSAIHLLLIASCALTRVRARRIQARLFEDRSRCPPDGRSASSNRNGRVSVRDRTPAPRLQIQATIRCSAPTADEARRCARCRSRSSWTRRPRAVRTVYPNNWRGNISYNVDYDITMPATAPLDLRNRFGNTDVSNLQAPATINSGNGSVTFLGGRGRQRIENSFGNVEVRNNDGDVTVINGNGSVIATDITGAVDITNRFGNIRVVEPGRGLTIHSNNGNIEAENIGGAAVITTASAGSPSPTPSPMSPCRIRTARSSRTASRASPTCTRRSLRSPSHAIGKALTVRAQNAAVRGDTVNESATVETTFGSVDLRDVKGGARVTTGNSPHPPRPGSAAKSLPKPRSPAVTITKPPAPSPSKNQNGSVIGRNEGRRPLPADLAPHQLRPDPRHGSARRRLQPCRPHLLRPHPHRPGAPITVSGDIAPGRPERQNRRGRLRPPADGPEHAISISLSR